MRRRWEWDRGLAHVPLGWRRVASDVCAVAGEHGLVVNVAVRWAPVAHPACPSLVVVETPPAPSSGLRHRTLIQQVGRGIMDRIAGRAVALCMSCGRASTPAAHVALQASGTSYVALLCAACEDDAVLDGLDFWYCLGRYDPLTLGQEGDWLGFSDGDGGAWDGSHEPEDDWPGDGE